MNFLLQLCVVAGITTTEGAVRLIEKKILMALLQFLTLVKAIQWTSWLASSGHSVSVLCDVCIK